MTTQHGIDGPAKHCRERRFRRSKGERGDQQQANPAPAALDSLQD
jgi:hypothetical protein